MSRSSQRGLITTLIANDHSTLTDELKLGEDNSDPIKVHPEPNCISSPRQSVRVLATETFPKVSMAITRIHLLSIGHHLYLLNRLYPDFFGLISMTYEFSIAPSSVKLVLHSIASWFESSLHCMLVLCLWYLNLIHCPALDRQCWSVGDHMFLSENHKRLVIVSVYMQKWREFDHDIHKCHDTHMDHSTINVYSLLHFSTVNWYVF